VEATNGDAKKGDSTKGDAEYWGLVLLINHVLV
jgi:hypothetical protein